MQSTKAANTQKEPTKEATIVLWGRTGAGKSSLGNKLAKQNHFTVGHTLQSETSEAKNLECTFKGIKLNVIDTPGFGDNRTDVKNEVLLANVLKTLKGLEGGFNLGIFCIPATKTRIDDYDIREIQMLGSLLGHDVFAHTIIALTQIDKLSADTKKEVLKTLPQQIPGILKDHGFEEFSDDRILVSNFDNFEKDFVEPFWNQIQTTEKFTPEISKNIDLDDPKTIEIFLSSPAIKALFEAQEKDLQEKVQALEAQNEMFKDLAENNKIMKAQMEKRNEEITRLQDRIQDVRQSSNSNPELIAALMAIANKPTPGPQVVPFCNMF